MNLIILRKYEELVELIEKNHPEWKNFTCRHLKDISGYSFDASRLALLHFSQSKKQSKKRSRSSTQKTRRQSGGGAQPTSPPLPPRLNSQLFDRINDDTIEQSMLDLLNAGKVSVPLIGQMIQFYSKIRGHDDKIKDDINMEDFLNLGKTLESSD